MALQRALDLPPVQSAFTGRIGDGAKSARHGLRAALLAAEYVMPRIESICIGPERDADAPA